MAFVAASGLSGLSTIHNTIAYRRAAESIGFIEVNIQPHRSRRFFDALNGRGPIFGRHSLSSRDLFIVCYLSFAISAIGSKALSLVYNQIETQQRHFHHASSCFLCGCR